MIIIKDNIKEGECQVLYRTEWKVDYVSVGH